METLSAYLAERMCRNDIISEDDKKFYAYSIQLLIERTLGLILIAIFAFVFKAPVEVAVFLITFILIRINSDGLHCKTTAGCFAASVLTAVSTILVASFISSYPWVCIGCVAVSAVVIFAVGTIRDPNLDLSDAELKHLRKRSRIGIAVIAAVVLTLLFLYPQNHFVYFSALGIIYNALSLISVKILRGEVTGDEKERV